MTWNRHRNPWVLGALGLIVVLILFVFTLNLGIRAFGFRAYKINSSAMAPTLQLGERILVNARSYMGASPQRGDVVTFMRPEVSSSIVFVKRVIALGGDTIEGKGDIVKLNGTVLEEPYIAPIDAAIDPPVSFGPETVPAGKVFLIGDARQISNDSRYFGFVDLKNIRGKVIYIWVSKNSSRTWTRVK
jgi:signal peptidase I